MVKTLPGNAGDMGSITGPGRFHKLQVNEACTTTPEPVF